MLSTICRPAARLQALGCRPSYTAQPAIIRMPAFHRLGTEELLGWNIAAGAYELTRGIHDLIKPAAPCPVKDPPGEHPGNRTDKGNSLPGVDEAMRGGDSSLLGKLFSVVNDTVRAVAGDSELARGGLTLAIAGATAATARVAAGVLLEYCKRKLLVRAEIDSRDDAYRWMMFWLMQQKDFRSSPVVSVTTSLKAFGSSPVEEASLTIPGGSTPRKFMLLPAPGDHLMWYRGSIVLISRQRAAGNPQLAANARLMLETLRIVTPLFSRGAVVAMIEEARRTYIASQAQRTSVYAEFGLHGFPPWALRAFDIAYLFQVDPGGDWTKAGSRPVRPLSSVVLPPGVAEGLLADCKDFLASEAWYAHRGIPYRRGYLLHGLPGTGKTSLVTALAGELGCNLYVVSLNSSKMTDETLGALLTDSEDGSILLLEDVDAAFVKRDRVGGEAASVGGLSFSGLLNAIDGVAAQEGRMLFMTTNHIERLSEALIRPGRVDVRTEFTFATDEQKQRLFISFFLDESQHCLSECLTSMGHSTGAEVEGRVRADGSSSGLPGKDLELLKRQAKEFVELLKDTTLSMAELQGFLMNHKSDPGRALRSCPSLVAKALQGRHPLKKAGQGNKSSDLEL